MKMTILALFLFLASSAFAESRYIAHIAQSPEWRTTLNAVNTCDETVENFRIRFFNGSGDPQAFRVGLDQTPLEEVVHDGGTHGVLFPNRGRFILFDFIAGETLSGYGELVDRTGCVSIETGLAQRTSQGLRRISYASATRPEQSVLLFYSSAAYETSLAIGGVEGAVRLDAFDGEGNMTDSRILSRKHVAGRMRDLLPGTRDQNWGILRIYGECSAIGLNFLEGEVDIVVTAHPAPE